MEKSAYMEINLKYRPHKHQKKLHDDGHRYLVICAGRRFGKSVFARQHCILNAIYDAIGVRITDIPVDKGKVRAVLEN